MKIIVNSQSDAIAICRMLTETMNAIHGRLGDILEMSITDNLCAVRDSIVVEEETSHE
jgi:hypothetical protein